MNREQRRAEARRRMKERKNYKKDKDIIDIITKTVFEKVQTRLKETGLNHAQVNYTNIAALSKLTDMQYADQIRHDNINNIDYLCCIIYFGNEQLTVDKAKIIIRTCEQSNNHKWRYSVKDKAYLDTNAAYIEKIEVSEAGEDDVNTNLTDTSDNTEQSI